jgi:two-component system nitrogen regulation sensor histidine kinase GlnL
LPPLRAGERPGENGDEVGSAMLAKAIVSAAASSVLVIDAERRLVFLNPAAEQLFGASRSVLVNRPLTDVVPEDSSIFDLIRRVRVGGASVSDYAVELPLMRGLSRRVDIHISPMPEQIGQALIMLHPCSVAHDLNQRVNHRGRARSVAGLGATLAHEVKNPLSGIRGAAQLLEPGVAEEERPLIRLICDETDRISALVDRMEHFAALPPRARGPDNIYEVLERVRRLSESGFGRRVRFVERYDPSLPEVDGDRDQLVQVFLNLVKNAVEAVGGIDGEVTLVTQYTHGLWIRVPHSRERVELPITVDIQDNGPGVSDDIAAHLFEPFVSTKRTGSGLGLSLAAKIVGDHGGVIEFENIKRGARFRVHLPAYRGPRAAAKERPPG